MKLTAQQERGSLEAWFYLYSAYMKSQGPSARLILDAFERDPFPDFARTKRERLGKANLYSYVVFQGMD